MAKSSNPLDRFPRAEASSKQRLIGLSIGEVGSRKTSFWLEGPAPVVLFSFDHGTEGVVDRLLDDGKEIYIKEYLWVPKGVDADEDKDKAVALRDEFEADYEAALANARTVIIDKETDLWELFRFAEFGAPNDDPKNYAALNQRYRKLWKDAKAGDVNLGLIERMKDKWGMVAGGSKGTRLGKTDLRQRSGWGELADEVHFVLTHSGVNPDTWNIEVGKMRGPGALDVAGQEYTFEMIPTFKEFAQLVFPESSEGDWE